MAARTTGDAKIIGDRSGLPAWSYFSEEMLEEEKELLFRRHWQLVGVRPDQYRRCADHARQQHLFLCCCG